MFIAKRITSFYNKRDKKKGKNKTDKEPDKEELKFDAQQIGLLLDFFKSVTILNKFERKYFYDLVIEDVFPPKPCRAEFWKACCGSKGYRNDTSSYCKGYYQGLQKSMA